VNWEHEDRGQWSQISWHGWVGGLPSPRQQSSGSTCCSRKTTINRGRNIWRGAHEGRRTVFSNSSPKVIEVEAADWCFRLRFLLPELSQTLVSSFGGNIENLTDSMTPESTPYGGAGGGKCKRTTRGSLEANALTTQPMGYRLLFLWRSAREAASRTSLVEEISVDHSRVRGHIRDP